MSGDVVNWEAKYRDLERWFQLNEAKTLQIKEAVAKAVRSAQEEIEQYKRQAERAEAKAAKLQALLAEEVQQRNQEASTVEEKAAKVKDWVTRKVQELEHRATEDGQRVMDALDRAYKSEQALATASEQLQVWEKRARTAETRMHQLEAQLKAAGLPTQEPTSAPPAGASAGKLKKSNSEVSLSSVPIERNGLAKSTSAGTFITRNAASSQTTIPSTTSIISSDAAVDSSQPLSPSTATTVPSTPRSPSITTTTSSRPSQGPLSPTSRGRSDMDAFKTVSIYTQERFSEEPPEHSGYLHKQGAKVKIWKRRFFLLRARRLYYYKSEDESEKGELLGCISLSGLTSVALNETADSKRPFAFEIQTPRRSHILAAASHNEAIAWIAALQTIMNRNSLAPPPVKPQPVLDDSAIQGWLIKHKRGFSSSRWFILQKNKLLYFKSPMDKTPIGFISLEDVSAVEVIDAADESDAEEAGIDQGDHAYFALHFKPRPETYSYYFEALSRQEMEKWVHHLMVVVNEDSTYMTETERLINQMNLKDNPDADLSAFDKIPILIFQKDPITEPLTSLSSERLRLEAVEMFKSIQSFTSTVIDQKGVDYHVGLAQSLSRQCLNEPEHRNEIFCQLIKQTKNQPYPSSARAAQAWQLIAILVGVFLPVRQVLPYLRHHLKQNTGNENSSGLYAQYALNAIDRIIATSERVVVPSRLEILSILLLQDAVERTMDPLKLDVGLLNGQEVSISFSVFDKAKDITELVRQAIGLEMVATSPIDYGLFLLYPNESDAGVHVRPQERLADVISVFEHEMAKNNAATQVSNSPRNQNLREAQRRQAVTVRLVFKIWLFSPGVIEAASTRSVGHLFNVDLGFSGSNDTWHRRASPSERLFMFAQANHDIVRGVFPLTEEAAIGLACLQAQVEWGDHYPLVDNVEQHKIAAVIDRFLPVHLRPSTQSETQRISGLISDKWTSLRHKTAVECVFIYLAHVKLWPFFGSSFFNAVQSLSEKLPSKVILAIKNDGIYILEPKALNVLVNYKYNQLLSFGDASDSVFHIVVDKKPVAGSQKILFKIQRASQVTETVGAYLNALIRSQGADSFASGIQNSSVKPPSQLGRLDAYALGL